MAYDGSLLPAIQRDMGEYQIEFQPIGRRGPCPSGETLLDCARRLGVELVGLCGGVGKCHGCKLRIVQGSLSEVTPSEQEAFTNEELESGWRLACKTIPEGDCRVDVPPESLSTPQRLQIEGQHIDTPLDSPVTSATCVVEPPSLTKPVADAENVLKEMRSLGTTHFDICVLRDLSTLLREWKWNLTAHTRNGEIIAVSRPGSHRLGLAVDLGSTKIAGYLLDLDTGTGLTSKGIMNPQISYGEDIIARINLAIQSPEGRTLLANLVRDAVMKLAEELCSEAETETGEILEAAIVGNTAMHHLMLGLPVLQLAKSPFLPAVRGELNVKARDIGLAFAPGAYVYFPPNIAGFVGPDHLAALMATADKWSQGNALVLDIGTNTEISLIARGKITSTSCASGPTFEGYHIRDGVRATPGAIEKVYVRGKNVSFKTIDDAEPIGICGSGILDAVSQLRMARVLDKGGRMQEDSHDRLIKNSGHSEFILVSKDESGRGSQISITQMDVREVQLGKAAIQAAIEILVETAGLSQMDIDNVIIAGAFGSYIDIANAIAIGMLPTLPLGRFHQVGNAAGTGARLFLMSSAKRKEVEDLLDRITYLELAGSPEFSKAFTRACLLEPFHLTLNAGPD